MSRLYNILDAMQKPILYDTFTIPSREYAANASFWLYSQNYQVPEHTGYTPIGLIGVNPSNQSLLICNPILEYPVYGRRLAGYVRNSGTSALTDTIVLRILYVKTSMLSI